MKTSLLVIALAAALATGTAQAETTATEKAIDSASDAALPQGDQQSTEHAQSDLCCIDP